MAKFVKRPYKDFIHHQGAYVPGKPLEFFKVEKAKTVSLHCEDQLNHSVLVKDISRKANGTFTGIVWGFEPPAMKLGDLKIDDSVTFTEDEVFSAIKEG
jgi:hypothetical protein